MRRWGEIAVEKKENEVCSLGILVQVEQMLPPSPLSLLGLEFHADPPLPHSPSPPPGLAVVAVIIMV